MQPLPQAGRMLAFLLLFACLLAFLAGLLPALGLVPAALVLPCLGAGVAALWWQFLRPLAAQEVALRRGVAAVEDLYNRAPCGYLSLDAAGRFSRINDVAIRLLGHARADLLGRPLSEFVAPESRARLGWLGEGGVARDLELMLIRDGGTRLPVMINAAVDHGDGGVVTGWRASLIDLTSSLQAIQATEQARATAERANKAKSDFLARMSHELRTPLAGIIGLAQLIGQEPLADEQRRHLVALSSSAEAMLSLLNGILDLAKVEAGKLELESIPFGLHSLAEECAAVLAPAAEKKGVAFKMIFGEGLPPRLVGDPSRLRQVLLNLLGNAVKFTDRGEVELTIEGVPVSEGWKLSFRVRDTGVGIPTELLATIFEPFAQAGPSTARTHGGTGLGLSISSRLVERMGGCLQACSQPGEGSVFAFSLVLPVATEPAPAPAPPTPAPSLQGAERALRVLVAEDTPINQEVMAHMLRRLGCQHALAQDGAEAVEMSARETFAAILMDVQMPVMDGLRATRLIRAREKATGGRLPIIAVTANAMQGERERCLAAGMDGYLTKPVRFDELGAVVRSLGNAIGTVVEAATPTAVPDWKSNLTALGFDREAMARLARTFADTVPPRLAALRQAVEGGDAVRTASTAHSLRGSLTVFGAKEAVASAQSVEDLAHSGRLGEAAPHLAQLERETVPLIHSVTAHLAS